MTATQIEVDCPNCGTRISIPGPGRYTCPSCAQEIDVQGQSVIQPWKAPSRREDDLFRAEGTVISRSQVIAPGAVISIANISGVTNEVVKAKRFWPILCICLGALCLGNPTLAAIFIIPAGILLCVRRIQYAVVVHSGGTEFRLIFTKVETAQRATYALSQAMMNR